MKVNKRLIFNIISFIFLGGLLGIFGSRLVHYYLLENKPSTDNNQTRYLSDTIIDVQYPSSFLVTKNGIYIYHGDNPDNYLSYAGLLWRIIKVDGNKNIVAVSEETNVNLAFNDTYPKSSINKWLNVTDEDNTGIFYQNLTNQEAYLVNTNVCLDVVDNLESITCDNVNKDYKVGILSLNDYEMAGGSTSYLNNHSNWWTSNLNKNNKEWYISSDGEIGIASNIKNYGIRPVVTIDSSVVYIDGSGTKEDPFIIEEDSENVLNQKKIGQYVNYSNHLWRIVSQEKQGTKVVMDGYLKVNNNEVLESYSTKANVYSLNSTSIGYYLNNTFYKTLTNRDHIVEGTWYVGSYSANNNYQYQDIYKESLKADIGLLSIADMFVSEYPNTYTLTGTTVGERTVYTIDNNKELYRDFPTKKLKIRPALYLDSNLIIKGGKGTASAPYEIEG